MNLKNGILCNHIILLVWRLAFQLVLKKIKIMKKLMQKLKLIRMND